MPLPSLHQPHRCNTFEVCTDFHTFWRIVEQFKEAGATSPTLQNRLREVSWLPKVAELRKRRDGFEFKPRDTSGGGGLGHPPRLGSVSGSAKSGPGGSAPRLQRSRVPETPVRAARAGLRRARSCGPTPTRCHWTAHASVSRFCPMRREPAPVAGRWRPARGHRRARGTPARGWPGNALRSRLRPLPAAERRGAGGPAGGQRAARESGRREPSRPEGVRRPRSGHVPSRVPPPA